eukprot:TRINITY_DN2011_c0_g1_i1.p1 TRINITY_DN2011_c0_g1~~TRINITY_DN2011_c0_g1_i1.p1  ORF type:complete len:558 (-),score=112.19 TRINITY_DN2011_c0_g1_i1:174-1847(-)
MADAKSSWNGPVSVALVMAASRPGQLDTGDTPKCLVTIGERPLIHHALQQIYNAGIRRVVVTVGYKGEDIVKYIEDNNVFKDMQVQFVFMSLEDWACRGHAYCILQAKELIGDVPFLLTSADHIFHPALMSQMCHANTSEGNVVLIETDLDGMVGLPSSVIQVRRGDIGSIECIQREIIVGTDSPPCDSVSAGLFTVTPRVFTLLAKLAETQVHFTLAEALAEMASLHQLNYISTDGLPWFAIETPASLEYTLKQHNKYDSTSWFRRQSTLRKELQVLSLSSSIRSDHGELVLTLGRAKASTRATHSGGEWSEFSVDTWRNSVFTAGTFFRQLYVDTESLAQEALGSVGGGDGACIIEVGCGTGEFLFPLVEATSLLVGVDINTKFIEWCDDHRPQSAEHKLRFVTADATKLEKEIKEKAPSEVWNKRRIVACVGNTFGIIPRRKEVLREMIQVAGDDGILLIVYWNAAEFPNAIKNFYEKNPKLCGDFQEEHVNYKTCTLRTPSGYETHWTSVEEAKSTLRDFGLEEIKVEARGNGVLVLAKKPTANGHTCESGHE